MAISLNDIKLTKKNSIEKVSIEHVNSDDLLGEKYEEKSIRPWDNLDDKKITIENSRIQS